MKKRLKMVVLAMFVIIWNIANFSLAANEQVEMKTTKEEVKSGDTFEVTISQESDGIVGFESTLSYDTNVFSLTKKETGTDWKDMGNNTKLDVIADNSIDSGDVFKLTFTVKEGISSTTSDIKLTGIKLYKTSTDTVDIEDESVSIKVTGQGSSNNDNENNSSVTLSKIEITKAPNTTSYKEGETFNTNGMIVTATYSDNTSKAVTNYTYSPNTALRTENKLVTISYTENGVTKSTTQAINVSAVQNNNNNSNNNNNNQVNRNNTSNTNQTSNNTVNKTNVTNTPDNTMTANNLPKTGSTSKFILLIVAGLIGIAFVAYKGYQKYKEI